MTYLILSDIHSNLDALEAVLADARGRYDSILVLGDLVGYGSRAEPGSQLGPCEYRSSGARQP